MDDSNNLIQSLKHIINENNFKIDNENKQKILDNIKEYLDFVKSKSDCPDKVQNFETIQEDYLLFLYFVNNVQKQFSILELSFKLN